LSRARVRGSNAPLQQHRSRSFKAASDMKSQKATFIQGSAMPESHKPLKEPTTELRKLGAGGSHL
jgi:hypothetical protein